MLFTTSHSITNPIKENLKCDKILDAVDVIQDSSFSVL